MLFVYFLLASINLGPATYLAIFDIPNVMWYNVNGFCSLLSLSLFFYQLIQRRSYRRLIKRLSIAGLALYVVLLIFWDDQTTFFSSGYSVSSLLIITYCLLFLKEYFLNTSVVLQYPDTMVWVVSGLFSYYLCSYVIQVTYKIFTRYFTNSNAAFYFDTGTLWGIHNVIYFLACVFIIISIINMHKAAVILQR